MRVAIVGLGLGGAALGASLAARGADFTVFEQATEIREVGAGVAIWPNVVRLLERLGIGPRVAEIGVRIRSGSPICDPQGNVIQTMSGQSRETAGYTVHRAEFLNLLSSLIPPDRVRLGKRCVGVDEREDRVRLSFADGSSEDFDLVLGADGIKSVVLPAVTEASEPIYSNIAAYRALIPNTPDLGLDRGCWMDRKKYFLVYPVSGGTLLNLVAAVPTAGRPEESWFAQGSREELAAEFEGWDPRVGHIASKVKETFRWGLYYRTPLRTIISRRVALLGDAAHAMLIHSGQGLNQAIEDAVALAVMLADCPGDQVTHRLKMYEDLRLERATAVQTLTRRNAQYMHEHFILDPGVERPARIGEMDWVVDYDVEREAEIRLRATTA